LFSRKDSTFTINNLNGKEVKKINEIILILIISLFVGFSFFFARKLEREEEEKRRKEGKERPKSGNWIFPHWGCVAC